MSRITFFIVICSMLASLAFAAAAAGPSVDEVRGCLRAGGVSNVTEQEQHPQEYARLRTFSIQNLRYTESWVPQPPLIVVPSTYQHVQATVKCCVSHGWQMRVRSGGHSYEAQSSWSDFSSFLILDLMLLCSIRVNITSETAWVEGGATLGNIYTAIANHSDVHGFPAGTCPTVGAGGHISGGGYGMLTRKYGLAADHVEDALLVDARGEILDRKAMGEDVFWALRGGGGGNWGVVLAWKLRLVRVPRVVTVFAVEKSGCDVVSELMYKWQRVGPSATEDLQLRTTMGVSKGEVVGKFYGLYLGGKADVLRLLNESFPEMGVREEDCYELSYFSSVDYYAQEFIGKSMVDRYFTRKAYFKAKLQFLKRPMPKSAYMGFCRLIRQRVDASVLITPFGGAMDAIPWHATPFPHRAGNLMIIHYGLFWSQLRSPRNESRSLAFVSKLVDFLRPYTSGAYVNYLDLDLGYARNGTCSVEWARRAWGNNYFGPNFDRLISAKTSIDPSNFFRSAQSVPSLSLSP